VTGGENGLRGNIRPAILVPHRNFYWAVLAVAAPLSLAMWRFARSPFCLRLRGIRDSETRMQSLGYHVPLHLFIAFTVSGFFAGIAGAMYAFFNNFVSPSTVSKSALPPRTRSRSLFSSWEALSQRVIEHMCKPDARSAQLQRDINLGSLHIRGVNMLRP